jgi:hypothetical protein
VAFAFSGFNIAFAMFDVADRAQFTFVTFVAHAFSFFAVTVVPAVIWACFVLAAFTSPVGIT